MTDISQPDIDFIYEPVQAQLDMVVDSLRRLAGHAKLSAEGGLLEHAIVSGGKKVRPTVTLLAGALRDGPQDKLVTMATAVELLHIATLIHDDTVDKAETRRGRATISNIWGNDVAVLLGDYVFATSATYVCDTDNLLVVRRFSETIMELAQGELAEYFSTHDWGQSIDQYNERIYNKTASLFCTAAEAGGVLSGAPGNESQALSQYGYNLGMAFQIMDDLLDFTGTEEELGKPVGNDLLQGTVTLPVLLFAAQNPDLPAMRRLTQGSQETDDLLAVVDLVRASSVIDETVAVMDGYKQSALDALTIVPRHRARESLEALTNYVSHRRS
jgi:heptaprenyl diphosphate synthase/octaprenyl-diphosphate synthase